MDKIVIAMGLSDWPSWQRHKSCGTFAWVRVQLQTGVLSLLFSDNTYTADPSSEFEEQTLSICIWVMSSRPERTANAQWEVLKPP